MVLYFVPQIRKALTATIRSSRKGKTNRNSDPELRRFGAEVHTVHSAAQKREKPTESQIADTVIISDIKYICSLGGGRGT